jgi:hypothetical protein
MKIILSLSLILIRSAIPGCKWTVNILHPSKDWAAAGNSRLAKELNFNQQLQ